jgi:hypothetical protein
VSVLECVAHWPEVLPKRRGNGSDEKPPPFSASSAALSWGTSPTWVWRKDWEGDANPSI